jgi:hypothetical protein
MNNTRALAIVAVLTAATLVVGVTLAATPSAFADKKKDRMGYGSTDPGIRTKDNGNDGNTVTAQVNKQKASQSGYDNDLDQDAINEICTHPEEPCTGFPVM